MASTNKTALGLTQYALDDIPDMTDTNNDNAIITAELQKRPEADTDGKYPKAANADTAGTADNAKNAVEGSALDARLETIEADIQQQQEDLADFPTSGTAAVAKKLETAREIALTGAVTGRASFDGSGDINLLVENMSIIIPSKSTGYYKIAETTISEQFKNRGLILLVTGEGETGNASQVSNTHGLLRIDVRNGNPVTSLSSAYLIWEFAGKDIVASDYMLLYKADGGNFKAELWMKANSVTMHFLLLEELQRTIDDYNSWTFDVGYAAELPSGYTQIPSTYSNLKTGKIFSQGETLAGTLTIGRMGTTANSHQIFFEGADGRGTSANIYNCQISFFGSPTHPYFWVSGLGTLYDGQRIQFRNISDPADNTEVVTKGYGDSHYLPKTGGKLTGPFGLESNSEYSPMFNLKSAKSEIKMFTTYTEDRKEKRFAIQTPDNKPIIWQGVADPTSSNDAVNLTTLNSRLATLEAKLTGKSIAEVMAANEIPASAPSLEEPGEEEITV